MNPKLPPRLPNPAIFCRSLVRLRAVVPEDAFTAAMLGCERVGTGIVIGADGLVLTIGYLITEASDVWLGVRPDRRVAGHALAYDQVTGLGLVMPLEPLRVPPIELGSSAHAGVGSDVIVASDPDLAKPQAARILARREFSGSWEYLIEEAIFTAPAHTHWSGAALLNEQGCLLGVGSLLVRETVAGDETDVNMFVPIDLLKPILEDLRTRGRAVRPSRPWLGIYCVEVDGRVYVTGVSQRGPAQLADVREGDLVTHVAGHAIDSLAGMYQAIWSLGGAGVVVPLTTMRGGNRLIRSVSSMDRSDLLKRPVGH